jgi:hypothetical protein
VYFVNELVISGSHCQVQLGGQNCHILVVVCLQNRILAIESRSAKSLHITLDAVPLSKGKYKVGCDSLGGAIRNAPAHLLVSKGEYWHSKTKFFVELSSHF